MSCPNCKSKEFYKKFISFSKVNYKSCSNCDCIYQDPIVELNYSDTYWQGGYDLDGNYRNFIKERKFKIKNWYGDTIDFINKKKKINVLDVGCGLGFFLSALNEDIQKFGIEDSKYACEYIKKTFKDINIINGGYEKIEKFNIKFDIIMFYHVIEHLKNPPDAIQKILKFLKKNGILIVGTPNVESFTAKIFGKNYRHFIPAHICLYGEKSLRKLLEKNQLEIIKKEKPFFSTDYNKLSNYLKILNIKKLSPAFYGSIFTYYCKKNT